MAGFSIEPTAFRCTAAEFAAQIEQAGIPGAGMGRYLLAARSADVPPQQGQWADLSLQYAARFTRV